VESQIDSRVIPGVIQINWAGYEERFEQAYYTFYIHTNLANDIDQIIMRNLVMDGVIHDFECLAGRFRLESTNLCYFDNFVSNNVQVKFFDAAPPIIEFVPDTELGRKTSRFRNSNSLNGPEWRLYSTGFLIDNGLCDTHLYLYWLIEFSDDYRKFWDIRLVEAGGCGRDFSAQVPNVAVY
jgi:hypothetical protein